jgi:hypothetical protein
MVIVAELGRALAALCAAGSLEVHENGQWLAGLDGLQYEVRCQGDTTLLHLWSAQQTLVRRVISVEDQSPDSVVVEVARLGHARHGKLELLAQGATRQTGRVGREQFRIRLGRLLNDLFPDETVDSLTTAADLHHSLSGSYTRGVMHRGSEAHAVLAAAPEEDVPTLDGILTFGLIWLDRARERARRQSVGGLRLFLPRGRSAITAHRLTGLATPHEVALYEYDPLHWRVRRVPISDAGNLQTWLIPRREADQALASAAPETERIRNLAPDAIRAGVAAQTQHVTLRFRGLEFARWQGSGTLFGLSDHQELLTPEKWPVLEKLVRQLETYRHPLASDTRHRFYRGQPERWLETMVAADPARIDPRLDPRHLYAQVPAFSAGDRGIIDLLGVMRDGRLAVLELKAGEDIHLILQAVDYWLRVRWHQQRDDFRKYGYFPGVTLNPAPPLLFLVAPGFRYHPSSDVVLRYLSREIEVVRVGLSENWRRGLRVIFRQ